MVSYWRTKCAPIVVRVLDENAGKAEREIRAALLAAYPFGPREYHPYRIWLDEIRIQMGKRQLSARAQRSQGRPGKPVDSRQQELFA